MSTDLDPKNIQFVLSQWGKRPLNEMLYQDAREALEKIQNFKAAPDVTQETVYVEVHGLQVKTIIFRPAKATRELNMIFYTHGGGWILGSPTVYGSLMEDFVRQTGGAVVFPCYTPAPREEFPTQFEESYGVLEHFVGNGALYRLKSGRFGLAGDGAGGLIAIGMTQLAHCRKLPAQIGQLVLLYPVTDTHAKSETYDTFKDGPYLSERIMDWMISAFLPNEAERNTPLASPLAFAKDEDLSKFPSTTIFLSGVDPLIGEGEAFGRRLQKLGVDAAILKAEGVIHDYVLLKPIRKSATPRAVTEFAAFKLSKAFAE